MAPSFGFGSICATSKPKQRLTVPFPGMEIGERMPRRGATVRDWGRVRKSWPKKIRRLDLLLNAPCNVGVSDLHLDAEVFVRIKKK